MKRSADIHKMREMYIDGVSITSLCAALGTTRQTFYRHKEKAKENGDNWDEIIYQKRTDIKDMANKEKEFLSLLINSFEMEFKKLDDIKNPELRLALLDKYVTSYYKIKAPIKTDCKVQVFEALSLLIHELGNLAAAKDELIVVEFLSKNSDFIISKIQTFTKGKK